MEDERVQCNVCVGNNELAVCDWEDLMVVGNVKSWWGIVVGVNSIVRSMCESQALSNEYIGGAAVRGEGYFWRVDGEYAVNGVVCGKMY